MCTHFAGHSYQLSSVIFLQDWLCLQEEEITDDKTAAVYKKKLRSTVIFRNAISFCRVCIICDLLRENRPFAKIFIMR